MQDLDVVSTDLSGTDSLASNTSSSQFDLSPCQRSKCGSMYVYMFMPLKCPRLLYQSLCKCSVDLLFQRG